MAGLSPAFDEIQRRSAVPGRERWESRALLRNPGLVSSLQDLLLSQEGVLQAKANPVTGRLLVHYDSDLTSHDVARTIRQSWRRVFNGSGQAAVQDPVEDASPSSLGRNLLLAGGAAVGARMLLGSAVLSPAVVMVSAAVVTAAVTYRWWRGLRAPTSSPTAESPNNLHRLDKYFTKYRGRFRLAAFFSVIHKVLDLSSPLLVGLGLAIVSTRGSPLLAAVGIANPVTQIWFLGALTVGIWSLESVFERLLVLRWRNLAQSIQHDLRIDAYDHVQQLTMESLESDSTGRISTVLTENINQIENFFNDGANEILQMATNFVTVSILYIALAPSLALVALLPMPLVLWGTFSFHRRIGPLYRRAREEAGLINSQLVSNIEGVATIRSFTSEEREIDRIRHLSHSYLEKNREAITVFSAYRPLIRIAVVIGFAGTIVLGGLQVLAGTLNPGTYAMALFLAQRFLWAFVRLGNAIDDLQKAIASVGRVFELLEAPRESEGGTILLSREQVHGEIHFDRVGFSYREGQPVLKEFSLHLPAGEITGIVGSTGVGKTSLVKLLLRFYEWDQGRILLDGLDLRAIRTRSLRQAIGLVSQDEFLFAGTIRENIAYSRPDATLEEVTEAARGAEAHRFIRSLPQGYESVIGERGVKLSGGERQRICVARAILKDAPILVFDEATSSVDNETEEAIQRSIERLAGRRTILVITHRLAAVRRAQCIHVLGDNGRIVEAGQHRELVGLRGLYSALWQVQTGGRKLAE